jgi:hypothetical protein
MLQTFHLAIKYTSFVTIVALLKLYKLAVLRVFQSQSLAAVFPHVMCVATSMLIGIPSQKIVHVTKQA